MYKRRKNLNIFGCVALSLGFAVFMFCFTAHIVDELAFKTSYINLPYTFCICHPFASAYSVSDIYSVTLFIYTRSFLSRHTAEKGTSKHEIC